MNVYFPCLLLLQGRNTKLNWFVSLGVFPTNQCAGSYFAMFLFAGFYRMFFLLVFTKFD